MEWMRISFLLIIVSTVAVAAESSSLEEPPYLLLYEQGFYDKAIEMLDSIIAADSLFDRNVHYYRAACFIARGDRDSGAAVFERLLAADSAYALDTLMTPPKILAVFKEVRQQQKGTVRMHVDSSTIDTSDKEPGLVTISEGKGTDSVVNVTMTPSLKQPPLLLQTTVGLFPGGTGAFYQRKPVHGVVVLILQAGAVGVSIWAYRTRETHYSKQYGWYTGNRDAYNQYTNYTRAALVVFTVSYVFSISDYFLTLRKRRSEYSHRLKR